MTDMQQTGHVMLFAAVVMAGCAYMAHDMYPGLIRDVCLVFAVLCGMGAYAALGV